MLHYGWLSGELDHPHLPADIPSAPDVEAAVFVQADCAPEQGFEEARWVASLDWPRLAGIVASVPLDRGEAVTEDLDRLRTVRGVVGVRQVLQDQPDACLEQQALIDGLVSVAAAGLPFDLCIRWPQLPAAAAMVRRVPGLTVVLDHLGKPPVAPGIDSAEGAAWLAGLRILLELDDVVVKLSGLGAETSPSRPSAPQQVPFIRAASQLAGPHRLLLGSDWPVSFPASTDSDYADWFEVVRAASGFTDHEWATVAHGTAERVYASS